jgi:hypothetical protein
MRGHAIEEEECLVPPIPEQQLFDDHRDKHHGFGASAQAAKCDLISHKLQSIASSGKQRSVPRLT